MQNVALGAFCNTFDLHYAIIGIGNLLRCFLEWPFYTGFTIHCKSKWTLYLLFLTVDLALIFVLPFKCL